MAAGTIVCCSIRRGDPVRRRVLARVSVILRPTSCPTPGSGGNGGSDGGDGGNRRAALTLIDLRATAEAVDRNRGRRARPRVGDSVGGRVERRRRTGRPGCSARRAAGGGGVCSRRRSPAGRAAAAASAHASAASRLGSGIGGPSEAPATARRGTRSTAKAGRACPEHATEPPAPPREVLCAQFSSHHPGGSVGVAKCPGRSPWYRSSYKISTSSRAAAARLP